MNEAQGKFATDFMTVNNLLEPNGEFRGAAPLVPGPDAPKLKKMSTEKTIFFHKSFALHPPLFFFPRELQIMPLNLSSFVSFQMLKY